MVCGSCYRLGIFGFGFLALQAIKMFLSDGNA